MAHALGNNTFQLHASQQAAAAAKASLLVLVVAPCVCHAVCGVRASCRAS
jgi:hypothetical protein